MSDVAERDGCYCIELVGLDDPCCWSDELGCSCLPADDGLVGVVPVEEGFSSSTNCLVRLINCLMAFRSDGLLMAQSGGHKCAVSRPNELDRALTLASREVNEVLVNSGGLRV